MCAVQLGHVRCSYEMQPGNCNLANATRRSRRGCFLKKKNDDLIWFGPFWGFLNFLIKKFTMHGSVISVENQTLVIITAVSCYAQTWDKARLDLLSKSSAVKSVITRSSKIVTRTSQTSSNTVNNEWILTLLEMNKTGQGSNDWRLASFKGRSRSRLHAQYSRQQVGSRWILPPPRNRETF